MKELSDHEIRLKGIEALNQVLGASGALKFLSLVSGDPTDYIEISRKLYEGQKLQDIWKRVTSTS